MHYPVRLGSPTAQQMGPEKCYEIDKEHPFAAKSPVGDPPKAGVDSRGRPLPTYLDRYPDFLKRDIAAAKKEWNQLRCETRRYPEKHPQCVWADYFLRAAQDIPAQPEHPL